MVTDAVTAAGLGRISAARAASLVGNDDQAIEFAERHFDLFSKCALKSLDN
jgi:hypothetical protein